MKLSIRKAVDADLPLILEFIDSYWRKGHAFQSDRQLLDHQHRDPEGGYCFSLALYSERIISICGWVTSRLYDPKLTKPSAWYTNWCTIPNTSGTAALRVQEAIKNFEPGDLQGTLGARAETLPLYRIRRYFVGFLRRYIYRIPEISTIDNRKLSPLLLREPELLQLNEEVRHDFEPAKTTRLIINKYLCHPRRRYFAISFQDAARSQCVIIFRFADRSSNICLLVDYVGTAEGLHKSIDAASFVLREIGCGLLVVYAEQVIPTNQCILLKAAEAENISVSADRMPLAETLAYAINSRPTNLLLLKGDGDQDRP